MSAPQFVPAYVIGKTWCEDGMRKWFRKFFSSGFFLPFVLLLPYVCTILLNGADKALLLYSPDEENLVPLLLMVQMKGDYEGETRKAQSVIARSEMYRRLAKGERAGQIMEEVSMELAGEKWEINEIGRMLKYADRMQENKNAAAATNGQVLTYNGELRLVPYHQISSGMTRNGEEVFHSTEYKYLKAVDSSRDKEAPDYINSTYVSVNQLPARLVIKERDSAGYITALTADESWLDGESFRQEMHLASANFTMQKVGKAVRFLCKGKGHGLGFSQYGGNEMAKGGSSWEEILSAYFPEMELQNIKSVKSAGKI